MPRKHWSAVAAAIALLAAADGIYWWVASDRLRDGVRTWAAAQRAAGWAVNDPQVAIGGWPFMAEARIPALEIQHAGTDIPGQANYRGTGLLLSVPLFHPTEIRVTLTGPQLLGTGAGPRIALTAAQLGLVLPLRGNGVSVSLHASNLRLDPQDGAWHATIGNLDAEIRVNPSPDAQAPAATVSLTAAAIALPSLRKWPLGDDIASLSLSGRLNGPVPTAKAAAAQTVTGWADSWRDGGGSLEIRHLAVTWGPLDLIASATLALDDQLQPMGSGSAKLVGYAETLDRLAAAGALTKSAATVAKAVLSLLAGTGEAGAPSSVDVPLTLQYRTLSMRQVPLARLPELDWPPR